MRYTPNRADVSMLQDQSRKECWQRLPCLIQQLLLLCLREVRASLVLPLMQRLAAQSKAYLLLTLEETATLGTLAPLQRHLHLLPQSSPDSAQRVPDHIYVPHHGFSLRGGIHAAIHAVTTQKPKLFMKGVYVCGKPFLDSMYVLCRR